jgi:hypothetical protein
VDPATLAALAGAAGAGGGGEQLDQSTRADSGRVQVLVAPLNYGSLYPTLHAPAEYGGLSMLPVSRAPSSFAHPGILPDDPLYLREPAPLTLPFGERDFASPAVYSPALFDANTNYGLSTVQLLALLAAIGVGAFLLGRVS